MRFITLSLVLALLLCTFNVVKGQDCSKEQFLSTKHFDVSKLEDTPNGNTVRVSCAVGYVAMPRFKCEQGLWIPQSDLPCEPVKCPVIQADNNVVVIGNSKDATYGNVIQFQCQSSRGVLKGPSQIECNNKGEWSGTVPTCEEHRDFCGPPPALLNGDTVGSKEQYRNGESVDYVCQLYYTISGSSHKTCDNGIWKGEITCLKPCTVNEQLMAQQNIKLAWRTPDPNHLYVKHLDHITFACIDGKRPTEDKMVFRPQCIDGILQLPRCQ